MAGLTCFAGNSSKSAIWSCIEINMAILCACLPIIRIPLQHLFPRLFHHHSTDHNYGSNATASTYVNGPPPPSGGWSKIASRGGKGANGLVAGIVDPGLEMGHVGIIAGATATTDDGSESERHILGEEGDEGKILRTTDFHVDYGK